MSPLRIYSKNLKIYWKKKFARVKSTKLKNFNNAVWTRETGAIHSFITDEKVNVTSVFMISG